MPNLHTCTDGGEGDTWASLSSALELLQWKGDVANSGQLLKPLSATLDFLLRQLSGSSGSGEEDRDAQPTAADNSRW